MQRKAATCGSTDTKTGKPCGAIALPCRFHSSGPRLRKKYKHKYTGKGRVTDKKKIYIESRMQGKGAGAAAKEAGYAPSTVKKFGKSWEQDENVKSYIEARMRDSKVATDEIIGTLVSQMRGDPGMLFDENDDPIMVRAKERGVSHLIKKVTYDHLGNLRSVEFYSSQKAAEILCTVFGLEQLPAPNVQTARKLEAAIANMMQKAEAAGFPCTREDAEKRLRPLFAAAESNAVN